MFRPRLVSVMSLGLQGNSLFLPGPGLLGSNSKLSSQPLDLSLCLLGGLQKVFPLYCFFPAFPLTPLLEVIFGVPCRIDGVAFLHISLLPRHMAEKMLGIIIAYVCTILTLCQGLL